MALFRFTNLIFWRFISSNFSARLLQARKTDIPSEAWLRELPHKARKLEARLYRKAPSLEAYLDRTTLKIRLKVLARALVRQFSGLKRSSVVSARTSNDSSATIPSHTAPTSVLLQANDSLRSFPMGFLNLSSISSTQKSQSWSQGRTSETQPESEHERGHEGHSSATASVSAPDQTREPLPSSSSRRSSSVGAMSSSVRAGAPSPLLTPDQMQQYLIQNHQQHLMNKDVYRQSLDPQQNLMATSAVQVTSDTAVPLRMPAPQTNQSSTETHMSSCNMSDIEHQRAVNARLQNEIAVNIQRQEQLARFLQGSDTTQEEQSLQLQNVNLRNDFDQRNFTSPDQSSMQQSTMQFNHRPSSLNMMGMMQGSVPSNSVMQQTPYSFFYDQQQRSQHPPSSANHSVVNPQQIYNNQQTSNLTDFRMGFGNSSHLMARSFGSHPQAVGNGPMQPNQLLQHQQQQTFEAIRPQLINTGNVVNLNFQQQLASLQGLQQSTHSAPDLFFSLPLGGDHSRGAANINFDNTSSNHDRPLGLVPRSEHFPIGGGAANSKNDNDDEGTALGAGNNDGGGASPLSPNSFRW